MISACGALVSDALANLFWFAAGGVGVGVLLYPLIPKGPRGG
jgi:hypothetical protein